MNLTMRFTATEKRNFKLVLKFFALAVNWSISQKIVIESLAADDLFPPFYRNFKRGPWNYSAHFFVVGQKMHFSPLMQSVGILHKHCCWWRPSQHATNGLMSDRIKLTRVIRASWIYTSWEQTKYCTQSVQACILRPFLFELKQEQKYWSGKLILLCVQLSHHWSVLWNTMKIKPKRTNVTFLSSLKFLIASILLVVFFVFSKHEYDVYVTEPTGTFLSTKRVASLDFPAVSICDSHIEYAR